MFYVILLSVCLCSLGLQYRTSWCTIGLLWNSA